jgi:hypothetical protein
MLLGRQGKAPGRWPGENVKESARQVANEHAAGPPRESTRQMAKGHAAGPPRAPQSHFFSGALPLQMAGVGGFFLFMV